MKRYALLLIGFPVVALFGFGASCERRSVDHAEHLYAVGRPQEARIVDKTTHNSASRKGSDQTFYELSILSGSLTHRRNVHPEDWNALPVGAPTIWYVDPASGEGIAEAERRRRCDRSNIGLLMILGVAFAVMLCRGWWQGLPGGAAEGRVRKGGAPCPPTLKLQLPKPEREQAVAWEAWLARKYPPLPFLLGLNFGGAAAVALPALLLDRREQALLMGLQAAFGAWTILLANLRGKRRDRRLWRTGEERHATILEAKQTGQVRSYELVFELGGAPYTLRQRMPLEGGALQAERNRIVVLVDPRNPRRAAVVPRGAEKP